MTPAPLSRLVSQLSAGHLKYGWYSSQYTSSANAVFAGGCSRSGTTLLYSFLRNHSRLFMALESGLCTGTRDFAHLTKRTGLALPRLEALYRASHCWPEFTERVLATMMRDTGKLRWGDKSPVNVTVIDDIFLHFPQGRFIHMIRDGRDVVCSLRTHTETFKRSRPATNAVNAWSECVAKWNTWVRRGLAWRGDPRYHEIRYESLIEDPERTLRELFAWLDEPWEPALLEKATQTRVASHPGVSRPVTRDSVDRWEADLPAEARELFRGPAAELLVELGYATDDSWTRAKRG